jgi:pimeloyl-ACP methyl ester carboxylesterase
MAGWLIGAVSGFLVWLVLRKRLGRLGITGYANMFRFRQHQVSGSPGEPWKAKSWLSLDGYRVNGFLLPGSEKLVVFAHGLGGSMLSRVELAEKLRDMNGASFLLIPMRGADGHPVKLATGGVNEVHDILGALKFAVNSGYRAQNIAVYGSSMGGSAAVKACSLAGELIPAGVVVHGAYSSFFASARRRTGKAGELLLKLFMPGWAVRNLAKFMPVFWLAYLDVRCRVEYIYGDGDKISPPEEGELMAGETSSEACRVTVIEGYGHPTGRNASEAGVVVVLNQSLNRIWNR